jgi:hypothetical protein
MPLLWPFMPGSIALWSDSVGGELWWLDSVGSNSASPPSYCSRDYTELTQPLSFIKGGWVLLCAINSKVLILFFIILMQRFLLWFLHLQVTAFEFLVKIINSPYLWKLTLQLFNVYYAPKKYWYFIKNRYSCPSCFVRLFLFLLLAVYKTFGITYLLNWK